MATNTAGTTARQYHTAQVHYLTKNITYSDNGSTLSLGYVPAGAVVINAGVIVTTAFNGNSSNVIDIGTAADTDGFASAISLATIGRILADDMATSNDLGAYASDTEMKCVVTATASASAGAATVFVEYLVPMG